MFTNTESLSKTKHDLTSGWAKKLSSKLLFRSSSNTDGFYAFYTSQGSVATQLRCDGMFSNHCTTNFSQNAAVKKFSKSVNIWQRYCHDRSARRHGFFRSVNVTVDLSLGWPVRLATASAIYTSGKNCRYRQAGWACQTHAERHVGELVTRGRVEWWSVWARASSMELWRFNFPLNTSL